MNTPLATLFSAMLDDLGGAARRYGEAGVAVFACVPGGKRPLPGGRGFYDATTDLDQITSWWGRVPDANIAIPTGAPSGVVVVDVDVHAVNGYEALGRARRAGLVPRPLALVETPSGGMHLYYPAGDVEQRSWQVARAGIDFRGDGGYIITPPSLIQTAEKSRVYRIRELHPEATTPIDAARLRGFLDPRPISRTRVANQSELASTERIAAWVAALVEGERNRGLFWAACRLVEQGLTFPDALDVLAPAAQRAGLAEREITATLQSAYRTITPIDPRSVGAPRSFGRCEPVRATPVGRGLV